MSSKTNHSAVDASGMPTDIAEWMGSAKLIHAATDAASQFPFAAPPDSNTSGCHSQTMLALFAYGLARGIQDSNELEKCAGMEPGLHHLCRGKTPTATALRSFRRRHAPAIETALTKVLRVCWKDSEEVGALTPNLEAEAKSRVRTSIWVDTVSEEI